MVSRSSSTSCTCGSRRSPRPGLAAAGKKTFSRRFYPVKTGWQKVLVAESGKN
jgi:hypothetical protein